ncbi:Bug family tripartite tricarboxylate transporter substrate binding protein [Rhodoplanes sp. Z2-YC6860]|uniref:Bug family tripartite tricarboxylate transporter substrate binding protein n=1 Tax=Rhodoplanes sp. Z2-YC6860 TaxID=674703 RepID=UPI00078D4503|nr:tripartite tricarboxylate transporter substrate binding protein [Rhodoplanes sp. Z2-YC6860]AMN41509.1 extra-cytoplasmic solute receptor protein [Rhodoplanes sp. Z2-YC6860]
MIFKSACIAAALVAATLTARAQSYPERPVRIVSGLLPGTSGDMVGRMLAEKLSVQMRQPVIFENRPGANGQIAAKAMKQSTPDGYNLLFTASSTMVTAPLISATTGFDVFKDFVPITQAAAAPLYLVVSSEAGISSTEELIEYAKKNPGKLNYGSVGRGSVFHFQGEALNVAAGINMVHVPYAASNMSNIIGDLMTDRLQVFFPAYSAVLGVLPLGKVKLLGVFADQRLPQRPELPLVKDAIPALTTVPSWFGLFGPIGLDAAIGARLESEVRTALKDPDVVRKLEDVGMVPLGSTSFEMAAQLDRQTREMKQLAAQIGIKPE